MTVLASDNFNRADGGLGANWTTISGNNNPLIVSNKVQASASGALNSAAFYNAVTWPNDQYSQVKIDTNAGTLRKLGCICRATLGGLADTYYIGYMVGPTTVGGTAEASVNLRKTTAGVTATLATATTITAVIGDIVRLEVSATNVKIFVGGQERLSATDALILSGAAGIVIASNINPVNSVILDDWEGGDFTVAGAVVKSRLALLGVGV